MPEPIYALLIQLFISYLHVQPADFSDSSSDSSGYSTDDYDSEDEE